MVLYVCGIVSRRSALGLTRTNEITVRTGQAHRTLAGHTAPVTCIQFDELHIVSGSLDKTIKVRLKLLRCV